MTERSATLEVCPPENLVAVRRDWTKSSNDTIRRFTLLLFVRIGADQSWRRIKHTPLSSSLLGVQTISISQLAATS